MDSLENKIKGSLYAFAIGDAMGATTEFLDKNKIKHTLGRVTDIVGGGWLNLRPGEVTDDTQMMICVYYGLWGRPVQKTDPNYYLTLNNICQKFREWANSNPPDIGNTCRSAIYSTPDANFFGWIKANEYRQQVYEYPEYGNGGVMRCLVPALMGAKLLALDQAYATHTNEFTQVYTEKYIDALSSAVHGKKPIIEYDLSVPTGYIVNTVINTMEWFRRSHSLEEAILAPVNDGGDSDTIAALTGGLAGAYYGYDHIPKRWIKQLNKDVKAALDEMTEYIIKNRVNN